MSVSYLLICFKKKNLIVLLGFPGGLGINNLPANSGDKGSIPGLGRSPGGGHDYLLHILAWRIPWTEDPGGYSPGGHKVWDMTE